MFLVPALEGRAGRSLNASLEWPADPTTTPFGGSPPAFPRGSARTMLQSQPTNRHQNGLLTFNAVPSQNTNPSELSLLNEYEKLLESTFSFFFCAGNIFKNTYPLIKPFKVGMRSVKYYFLRL